MSGVTFHLVGEQKRLYIEGRVSKHFSEDVTNFWGNWSFFKFCHFSNFVIFQILSFFKVAGDLSSVSVARSVKIDASFLKYHLIERIIDILLGSLEDGC